MTGMPIESGGSSRLRINTDALDGQKPRDRMHDVALTDPARALQEHRHASNLTVQA